MIDINKLQRDLKDATDYPPQVAMEVRIMLKAIELAFNQHDENYAKAISDTFKVEDTSQNE